jgi:hypothetical protein
MENNILIKRKVGRPKKIIKDDKNIKDNKKTNNIIDVIKEKKNIVVNFNDF